jgi:hypothetical protein
MRIPILFYITQLVKIIAALVGGFRYRNLPRSLKILEWVIIVGLVEVGVQWILASHKINNLWTAHLYTLFEFICVVLMYSAWMKERQNQVMLIVCLSAFILFWIVSKFTFEPFSRLDGWTAAISKILQITFSIFILVAIIKESDLVWTKDSRFWVGAGIIIYSAGSIFIFALFNKMLEISADRLRMVWHINWSLMIIANLFYARSFLCKR